MENDSDQMEREIDGSRPWVSITQSLNIDISSQTQSRFFDNSNGNRELIEP
jgi:hypothetical protein